LHKQKTAKQSVGWVQSLSYSYLTLPSLGW